MSIPARRTLSVGDVYKLITDRLARTDTRYIITTNSNKVLRHDCLAPISSLLSSRNDSFLPIRLAVPLKGGKGGFGSQLRAAGGRMSSKKKRGEEDNGSSRNLDGRRLRTINEAKSLAQYLVVKPEMDQQQKKERLKRLEELVESTERKKEEILGGKNRRVDGKWLDDKKRVIDGLRESILAKADADKQKKATQDTSPEPSTQPVASASASSSSSSSGSSKAQTTKPVQVYGWDDGDDEFLSDSSSDEVDDEDTDATEESQGEEPKAKPESAEDTVTATAIKKGKGKARAE